MVRWLQGLSLCISLTTYAADDVHFTVHDPASHSVQDFSTQTWEQIEVVVEQIKQAVDLLKFDEHDGEMEDAKEKYNRNKHFGQWEIVEDCYNTRAVILRRDSKTPVKFSDKNKCRVVSGTWKDPYSGKTITKADDIQIDHMVPLKNAYISGAWDWQPRTRCLFANYMEFDGHLVSSSGDENQRKSDKTPEHFMPANKAFACEYLKNWLEIKLIWELSLTEPEVKAIRKLVRDNQCSSTKMKTTLQRLKDQRSRIDDLDQNAAYCQ